MAKKILTKGFNQKEVLSIFSEMSTDERDSILRKLVTKLVEKPSD